MKRYRKRTYKKRTYKKRRRTSVSRALGVNPLIYMKARMQLYIPMISQNDDVNTTLNTAIAW